MQSEPDKGVSAEAPEKERLGVLVVPVPEILDAASKHGG